MTEAGRLTSVSDFKVIWCFVHVCVGVNKTFYKMLEFLFNKQQTISRQARLMIATCHVVFSVKHLML